VHVQRHVGQKEFMTLVASRPSTRPAPALASIGGAWSLRQAIPCYATLVRDGLLLPVGLGGVCRRNHPSPERKPGINVVACSTHRVSDRLLWTSPSSIFGQKTLCMHSECSTTNIPHRSVNCRTRQKYMHDYIAASTGTLAPTECCTAEKFFKQ